MPNYSFVKTPEGFLPADKDTGDFAAKSGVGELVNMVHSKDVNVQRRKKYWATLTNCIKRGGVTRNLYVFRHKNQLHFVIMQMLGIGEWMVMPNGEKCFKPDSIAFDNMEEEKFEEDVFKPAIELLCDLFDLDEYELMEEYL